MKKLAVVMTDNGAVYWGEPVKNYDGCITLQHVSQKENNLFPTHKGRLSIPLARVMEIIEVDDTFVSIQDKYKELIEKHINFKPNDKDDPSIADDWKIA